MFVLERWNAAVLSTLMGRLVSQSGDGVGDYGITDLPRRRLCPTNALKHLSPMFDVHEHRQRTMKQCLEDVLCIMRPEANVTSA